MGSKKKNRKTRGSRFKFTDHPLAPKFTRRYPWEKWFMSPRFTLTQGVDFTGMLYTMAQQVRNAAGPKRFNRKVRLKLDEALGTITVTVFEHHRPMGAGGKI